MGVQRARSHLAVIDHIRMTPGAGQRESKNFARVCKLEEIDEKMYIEVEVSGCNMNTKALKVLYHNIMLKVILYFVEIILNSTLNL